MAIIQIIIINTCDSIQIFETILKYINLMNEWTNKLISVKKIINVKPNWCAWVLFYDVSSKENH